MTFKVIDLLNWLSDVERSIPQIQKAYDWHVTQWTNLANAMLTAMFGLLASALLEVYKDTIRRPHFLAMVGGCVALYGVSYIFCRWKVSQLQRQFVSLYTLLLETK